MNKIVREHYPATKLPKDLRPTNRPFAKVTVTIEEERKPEKVMTLEQIFSPRRFRRMSAKEIDGELRHQRDAW